ncbi:alpha/beta hydrolase [Amylibacter ulvae]|uniref:Alpha/beta hydrolase n=2 Tax=Paramylibacter ulvae TaxID=1651968 RepID=A0ABQ3D905_9RHOB|nr:alpha/beta hydrolase [Amylibacter ulvae]
MMLKTNTQTYVQDHVMGLNFNGFHRIKYLDWGNHDDGADTLVCVHGVTRNGHDFDNLAERLCKKYRVICPDVVGRGESDHLINGEGYDYLQYNADMNVLLARLNAPKVDWLGTSMGGIIGMVLASLPQTPIRRLILNDIGPEIRRDSLVEIGEYIGRSGEFRNRKDLENYMRKIYAEFHPMSDDDWAHMVEHASVRTRTGKYRLRMDPAIGDAFRSQISLFDLDMWDTWEKIQCPVLILRGENSKFFSKDTAEKMLERHPNASLVEFADAGHTPTLRNKEQMDVIEKWLKDTKF